MYLTIVGIRPKEPRFGRRGKGGWAVERISVPAIAINIIRGVPDTVASWNVLIGSRELIRTQIITPIVATARISIVPLVCVSIVECLLSIVRDIVMMYLVAE